ncbi:hypothetical protein NEOKW01_0169 [Nematocida sp. AWRm80]|nr:hypothetical protein NEOKW01_0169 [Nematocida sp. AWRm80]
MNVLKVLEEDDFTIKTYSMLQIELELSLLERVKHSYHSELEKQIDEIGLIMNRIEENKVQTIELYLDSVFQSKLIEYGERNLQAQINAFNSELNNKSTNTMSTFRKYNIKKEEFNEILIEGCKSVRENKDISQSIFSSVMLYDLFSYCISTKESLEFLSDIHLVNIVKETDNMTEKIKNKYSNSTYKIDSYNNKYVFIELYWYIRSGLYDKAVDYIVENEGYFKEILNNFSGALLNWMHKLGFIKKNEYFGGWDTLKNIAPNEDPFKTMFIRIFSGSEEYPKECINTIEDFLWYRMIVKQTIEKTPLRKQISSDQSLFKSIRSLLSPPKALFSAIVLEQYKEALNILYDEPFKTPDALFIGYGVALRIKQQNPEHFPISRRRPTPQKVISHSDLIKARGTKDSLQTTIESINLYVNIAQSVSSLFLKPEQKLSVIQLVSSFISEEWLEDLVSEVFISSEDYSLLGIQPSPIHSTILNTHSKLSSIINVNTSNINNKILNYYLNNKELDKALNISSNNTTKENILINSLVNSIKNKKYNIQIPPVHNNPTINILTNILALGTTNNILPAINKTGLISTGDTISTLKKVEEIKLLPPEIKCIIPEALLLISKRLKESQETTEEYINISKSVVLLSGALDINKNTVREILNNLSGKI